MTDVVEIIKKAIFNSWKDGLAADAYLDAYARAALAALNEAGYVVVPREPTEDMLISGRMHQEDFLSDKGPYPRTRRVWKAMLSAAQPAPK